MEKTNQKAKGFRMVLLIQSLVFLYSLVSMLSKVASGQLQDHGLFSPQFIGLFAAMFGCLGVYAILWQQVLKRVDLTAAYVHKATTLIWSMLWSVTLFHESVRWNNVVGMLLVVLGIILVTKDD